MSALIVQDSTSSNINWNELILSRRSFLSLISSVPVFAGLPSTGNASIRDYKATLEALVNTLLPAYKGTPSGVELGTLAHLQHLGSEIPNYGQMLQLGCDWLNLTALQVSGKSFVEAQKSVRDSTLRQAFFEPENTLPQVFAARVRKDCMILYYSNPAAWNSLPFNGPIQPNGFPDHWQPVR